MRDRILGCNVRVSLILLFVTNVKMGGRKMGSRNKRNGIKRDIGELRMRGGGLMRYWIKV